MLKGAKVFVQELININYILMIKYPRYTHRRNNYQYKCVVIVHHVIVCIVF